MNNSKFYLEENENILYNEILDGNRKNKSIMIIGNMINYTELKFNRLQKFMWKKFFNVKIVDLEDKNE